MKAHGHWVKVNWRERNDDMMIDDKTNEWNGCMDGSRRQASKWIESNLKQASKGKKRKLRKRIHTVDERTHQCGDGGTEQPGRPRQ